MTRFVIVGCGAAKQDEPAAAKDLYTSTYFQKKRRYAETVGDQWRILSAEHGLVDPEQKLDPYETHIDDLSTDDLDALAHAVGMDIIDWLVFETDFERDSDELVVLAGRSYLTPLRKRETFATAPLAAVYPLQQNDLGGIGEQMAWLDQRVEAESHRQATLTRER